MVEQKHIHSYVECINFTKNIIGRIKRRIIQELHYLITLLGFDMLWEIKDISMEMCTQCNINCIYCGLIIHPREKNSWT